MFSWSRTTCWSCSPKTFRVMKKSHLTLLWLSFSLGCASIRIHGCCCCDDCVVLPWSPVASNNNNFHSCCSEGVVFVVVLWRHGVSLPRLCGSVPVVLPSHQNNKKHDSHGTALACPLLVQPYAPTTTWHECLVRLRKTIIIHYCKTNDSTFTELWTRWQTGGTLVRRRSIFWYRVSTRVPH